MNKQISVFALLLFGLSPMFATSARAEKPNIVLILADDVSADMFSCYGQPGTAKTPNIDRIASEGVQFRTCFAPAICGPSRALLMTGVYGNRTGAFRNDMWAFDSRGTLFTAQHSWAKLMRAGGYKMAVAGKWHCGAKEPWDEHVGFDEYCMWEGPDKIKSHFGIDPIASGQRKDIKLPDNRYWFPSMVQNGKYVKVTESDFGPDKRVEFLLDFMQRKAKAKQPFVAYWPTVIPHGPYSTTPDAGAVMDIELKKPNTSGMSKEEKTRALADYSRKQQQRFVNLIQYMDKLVGKLIVKTEELGIYENTYFIFCADNGTAVTAKDRGVERGVHVPYVVKGPGVKRRSVTDELTDFADIAPTLLDMAGIEHPTDVAFDGKSQLLFLKGETDTHRKWIYAYTGHPKIKTPHLDAMAATGIRFDRFYATASVCSPTRASCLTGRNNRRMNISNPLRADEGHLPQEEITIAEALKAKGYATGHFGKWHVGGFDAETAGEHIMPPWEAGFDECFSTHNVIVTHDPYAKLGKGGIKACYWHNGRNIPLEEAQNDPTLRGDDAAIVMNKAIDFIRDQVADKKPFLALVWFHNVHTPLGKNPKLMKQHADCEAQEQIYFSNITAVDTQVGVLRSELRKLGVADDTMVWFTSDNGPNLKGKKNVKYAAAQGVKFNYTPLGSTGAFRGWKRDCYEGGLRMPGILEWPAKIKQPFSTDFAAVTTDYFPTALDAAGSGEKTSRSRTNANDSTNDSIYLGNV